MRRWYGEGPLHFVILAVSLAVAGYAGVRLLDGDWFAITVWFVGAAVLHDLLLVPLYGLADRALRRVPGIRRRSLTNTLRVPTALSGLLLLVWFPLILGPDPRYERATALPGGVFLLRWLVISALLFAISALWRLTRPLRRRRSTADARLTDASSTRG
ncbi:hypothetical protein AB0M87_29350 [Streptomyces sp. NPDC051320]|uniref:hypothetical protein n=1 Tax=Streptomyces sp. NPDC051320 TaxID=3154644 RepID=UPI00341D0C31